MVDQMGLTDTLMSSLSNISAMLELELRKVRHDYTEILIRVAQPIIWLVVFGSIIGSIRAIPTGNVSYISFITPGVLVQSGIFIAIFYGITFVWERESGVLKKLLVTPTSRYAIVIGRSMSAGVRAVVQGLIIFPIAYLLGVTLIPNLLNFVIAFFLLFLATGGFAALSIFIATFFKTKEKFLGLGQLITLPLFFASSALYPYSIMPPLLRDVAVANPLSYLVDAIRGLTITGNTSSLGIDIAAIIIFDIAMFFIASVSFKRIIT